MQDLDNNMDELLRKAADNYGLKPGQSNWEIIAPQLEYTAADTVLTKRKNNFKKYSAATILTWMFLICGGIFNRQAHYKPEAIPAHKIITNHIAGNNSEEVNTISRVSPDYEKINAPANHKEQTTGDQRFYNGYSNNAPGIKIRQEQTLKQFSISSQGSNEKKAVKTLQLKNNAYNIDDNNVPATEKAATKTAAGENNTNNAPAVTQKITLKKQTGFYGGLLAGVSFNAVKYQGLRKPGFDFGLLAGYQFNKNISLETGLLYAKKNYYSDGKYFSMNKVGGSMPQGMQVLSLEGSTQLLEIPVRVKYSLVQKKNNTVYTAAGISSYVLLKEKNNYLTLLNGTKENIISTYPQSSGYFAASVHLGAGYEYKASDKINIRIEPYVQIPLKGIGVGSLPVMSAGIRAGFSFPSH